MSKQRIFQHIEEVFEILFTRLLGEDGKLVLYRHFVRSGDGAICEIEENFPFTVDDYPLLEKWPDMQRQFLGSETDSVLAGESFNVITTHRNREEGLGEPVMRTVNAEDISVDKSEASFLEPQVVLVKSE